MLTAQNIFDTAIQYLRTMPRSALNPLVGACQYRSPNGPCLVGKLLTDEEAAQIARVGLNTANIQLVARHGYLPNHLTPHLDLLAELQHLHDDPLNWKRGVGFAAHSKISYLAARHNLRVPQ